MITRQELLDERKLRYGLEAEIDRLREVLFQIYLACGEDPDGLPSAPRPGCWTPDVPESALQAVRALRTEYDSDDQEAS